jgi:leader peptidase (prepilin peptidase) / N-methyltransferase
MSFIFTDLFIFFLGLIIGSFLNCVIYRIEINKSFLRGRSICPNCKHVLAWYDLIPVISFLFLGGNCRYCKQKISLQYPSIEILTAVVFVWIFSFFNLPLAIFYSAIACLLLIAFVYDLKHFIIPDRVTYAGIIITFLYSLIFNSQFLIHNSIWAGLGAMVFFLIIFLVSRGKWMGFGDVKLAFLMGLLLGFPNILVALFFAFLVGAVIGLVLVLAKKKGLKSEVPFGPFLVLGVFIALFWGEKIITWYLNLIQI